MAYPLSFWGSVDWILVMTCQPFRSRDNERRGQPFFAKKQNCFLSPNVSGTSIYNWVVKRSWQVVMNPQPFGWKYRSLSTKATPARVTCSDGRLSLFLVASVLKLGAVFGATYYVLWCSVAKWLVCCPFMVMGLLVLLGVIYPFTVVSPFYFKVLVVQDLESKPACCTPSF